MNFPCAYDELVDPISLVDHPRNNNNHPDEQIKYFARVLKAKEMWRYPIVVSKRSGFIISGHGRKQVAIEMGLTQVPVDYQDFASEADEYEQLTFDNEIARWAKLDRESVLDTLKDIPEVDVEMLGIEDFEIPQVEVLDGKDEDDIPDVKGEPVTKRGDVWLMHDHILMCGDSTIISDVDKLMHGEKADLVYTDQPYGINEKCDRDFASRTRLAKGNSFHQIKNDDSIEAAIDSFNLCQTLNIPRQIWWGANYYAHHIPQTNNWIVWDKREEDKETDANSDCELAYVKSKWSSIRIFRHKWKGMIKASEHGQKRVHPTQKPIALAEWCFSYYKSEFKNVLDLFLGSGSTLIACEKTNRKCYGMELDEHYCDVIIERWQKYTGKEAVLESNNLTYNSIKEQSNVR